MSKRMKQLSSENKENIEFCNDWDFAIGTDNVLVWDGESESSEATQKYRSFIQPLDSFVCTYII